MSFVTHYRGRLHEYAGRFDESMLVQEVTLDEYLALQYPPALVERFPEQAQTDRQSERGEILAATLPGDTLWLWRWLDWSRVKDGVPLDRGGLAVRRAEKIIRIWLVWKGY
jgi:hypothetical protein